MPIGRMFRRCGQAPCLPSSVNLCQLSRMARAAGPAPRAPSCALLLREPSAAPGIHGSQAGIMKGADETGETHQAKTSQTPVLEP